MATIAQKIADLVGSDMDATLVPSYEELIRSAYNHVADLIPMSSELWFNNLMIVNTIDVLGETFIIFGRFSRRIIAVKRKDSTTGNFYVCKEVPWQEGIKKADSSSIFYGAKGVRNPVYYINMGGELTILPAPDESDLVKIIYFRYLNHENPSLATNVGEAFSDNIWVTTEGSGFPREAEHAAQIRAAILLLQARVSNAVQDDEDMELLQLLQGQIAGLQQIFQEEAQRLNIPDKKLGAVS